MNQDLLLPALVRQDFQVGKQVFNLYYWDLSFSDGYTHPKVNEPLTGDTFPLPSPARVVLGSVHVWGLGLGAACWLREIPRGHDMTPGL